MCSVTKDGCAQSESLWNGNALLGLSLDLQGLWAHGVLPVQVFLQRFLQLQRQTHNSSLFWAFPGVFHGKGLNEPGVPSISAGNHLQNLGSWQKRGGWCDFIGVSVVSSAGLALENPL